MSGGGEESSEEEMPALVSALAESSLGNPQDSLDEEHLQEHCRKHNTKKKHWLQCRHKRECAVLTVAKGKQREGPINTMHKLKSVASKESIWNDAHTFCGAVEPPRAPRAP